MELQTAIEILEYHQEWRLGKRKDMIHDPKKLTEALDTVLGEVKKLNIPAVVKSLPTDECVEQWWAEGQDQNEGFWQEAPYRTNGDVVEEIKTALKYFIETWQR